MLFFFLASFFSSFITAQAALVNVTIDDTLGDPLTKALITYSPPDAWNSQLNCIGNCPVQPDPSQLFMSTWHESTFSVDSSSNNHPNVPLSATVSFNGSAVYVFCALSRSRTNPVGDSDMSFYIDGVLAGTFLKQAPDTAGFDYQVPVFSQALPVPGPHTLIVENGRNNGVKSLLVLDSIVYTHDDGSSNPSSSSSPINPLPTTSASSSSSSKNNSIGTVVAVLVIVILLLLSALLLTFLFIRRRRQRRAIYAPYMPEGAVKAFPRSLTPRGGQPSPPQTAFAAQPQGVSLPAAAWVMSGYGSGGQQGGAGGGGQEGNWWVGRDRKLPASPGISTFRPFAELDPGSASFQRPQSWERHAP